MPSNFTCILKVFARIGMFSAKLPGVGSADNSQGNSLFENGCRDDAYVYFGFNLPDFASQTAQHNMFSQKHIMVDIFFIV